MDRAYSECVTLQSPFHAWAWISLLSDRKLKHFDSKNSTIPDTSSMPRDVSRPRVGEWTARGLSRLDSMGEEPNLRSGRCAGRVGVNDCDGLDKMSETLLLSSVREGVDDQSRRAVMMTRLATCLMQLMQ